MANKYIKNENGFLKEEEGLVQSTGGSDAGKIPALDNSGRLDLSVMPTGIAPDTASIVASENLAAGDIINIFDDAGTAKCRKADATTQGKEAHGFVLETVSSGANASVYFEGNNAQLTNLTAGIQYLSTTAGQVTHVPPSASGNVVQKIGIATSNINLNFEPSNPIILV